MHKVKIVNVQCRGSHLVLFIRIFIIRSVKYLPWDKYAFTHSIFVLFFCIGEYQAESENFSR